MSNLMRYEPYLPDFFDPFWNDAVFSRQAAAPKLPAVNVKETPKEFKVDMSLPGYVEKEISVDVDENVLTISAAHEEEKEDKDDKERVLRREFASSSFARSFTLPPNIDTEKIGAKLVNGVLNLNLPKKNNAPENKKKKIPLK